MKTYRQAILPLGFMASGMACGIKRSGKPDLALFYSDYPALASCLFTTNKIKAACIAVNKAHLAKGGPYKVIIVNSGNANCCTGSVGLRDAQQMTHITAGLIGVKKEAVLNASTGVIGKRLPFAKIKKSLPELVSKLSAEGIDKAKFAIMTTDTFSKEITVKINIGGRPVSICGIVKGAGMIAPNMATLLCFIFTDAAISQEALDQALKHAVENSFNCITVDGCMSTNDSVMAMANAAAGNELIRPKKHYKEFSDALSLACLELAKMTVKDAEGATKFIRIGVSGAGSVKDARTVALSIANSNLFKTAIYGQNPNYGRIMAAIGSCGVDVAEEKIKFTVSSLKKREVNVKVGLGMGNSGAVVYTSDLTPEYVKINAEYN